MMSWAEDMGYDAWDGEDFEIQEDIYRTIANERDYLDELGEDEFLDYVLKYGKRLSMNSVVGSNFPGYDIAERIKNNGCKPTEKQRTAIRNVYLYSQHGFRLGLY